MHLQNKLDELYIEKAQSKWLEEGKQNSPTFLDWRKIRSLLDTIDKLKDQIVDNPKDISAFCHRFLQQSIHIQIL